MPTQTLTTTPILHENLPAGTDFVGGAEPRLEAQRAGTWTVHAAKRSPRPAIVEITVTFQSAA